MKKLNTKQVENLFTQLSNVVLQYNPNANYCAEQTPEIGEVAQGAVEHYKLSNSLDLFNQFIQYREKFENKLARKYKINSDVADILSEYEAKKLPARIQIQSGLLDCVIGHMALSVQ